MIFRYLHLVEKLPSYPCIVDADGLVISFAPVTNCENTKVSVVMNRLIVEFLRTIFNVIVFFFFWRGRGEVTINVVEIWKEEIKTLDFFVRVANIPIWKI